MPSSSLFLRAGAILSALSSTALAGASLYEIEDSYQGSSFLEGFDFFTETDPTHGFVRYQDQTSAANAQLVKMIGNDQYIGVDYQNTEIVTNNGDGRASVRISTKQSYTQGLFVVDIKHMPGGICGTWPAFWSLGSGTWPQNGEIDIIEGVNRNSVNKFVLHTDTQCSVDGTGQTDPQNLYNCALDSASGASGCDVNAIEPNTYGSGFNANGGGVYAVEWTDDFIKMWFFPRGSIPASITAEKPDVSEFGTPNANFQGDCDISKKFLDHKFIFDTTFCGDWAGNVYAQSGCPMYSGLDGMASCKKFVAENPAAFSQAYWRIGSFKTFQKKVITSSSSSASSTESSTSSSVSSTSSSISTTSSSSSMSSSSTSSSVSSTVSSTSSSSSSQASSTSSSYSVTSSASASASAFSSSSTAVYPSSSSSAIYPIGNSSTIAYPTGTGASYATASSSSAGSYYGSSSVDSYGTYPSSSSDSYDVYSSSTESSTSCTTSPSTASHYYGSSSADSYDTYSSDSVHGYGAYPSSSAADHPTTTPAPYYPSSYEKPHGYNGTAKTSTYTYVDVCSTGYTTLTKTTTYYPSKSTTALSKSEKCPEGFTVTTKYCAKGCGSYPTTVTVTIPKMEYEYVIKTHAYDEVKSYSKASSNVDDHIYTSATPEAYPPPVPSKPAEHSYEHEHEHKTYTAPAPAKPKPTVYETKLVTLSIVPVPASEYYAAESSSSAVPIAYPNSEIAAAPVYSAPSAKEAYTSAAAAPVFTPGAHYYDSANITASYGTATGTGKQSASKTGYEVPYFTGAAASVSVKASGLAGGVVAAVMILFM